jgi:putative ABC transport system permease protein
VVGIFKNADDSLYWDKNPNEFTKEFFMDDKLFETLFVNTENPKSPNCQWFSAIDYNSLKVKNLEHILKVNDDYQTYFKNNSTALMQVEFQDLLKQYSIRALKLNTTLWVLQVPIFIVLAFFIFMVSKLIVDNEKNEIAVMKSRGASRFQVFMLFLIQSLIILGISMLVGPFLGLFICKVLGASNGFMELVQRSALELSLSEKAYQFALAAAAISIATMVVPVINYSRMTIVKHKQSKSRKSNKPFWQKFFIDFVCLAISLYGLYSYNNQKGYLAAKAADGAGLDPLLFFSSTLFIIGTGLVFLRALPLIIKLIFTIGKRFFSPSLYASFIKVSRSSGDEQFIMIFLILTLALGIFDAKSARTLNLNMEQKVNYQIGADIVLKQVWEEIQGIESTGEGEDTSYTTTSEGYLEPDYTKFAEIKGVEQTTKVLKIEDTSVSVDSKKSAKDVSVMGIITDEFGKTAWFRNDLTPTHWYNYLNKMAELSNGALVSRSFEKNYGVKVGDKITVSGPNHQYANLIVCDFIDYFPSYNPVTKVKGIDGQNIEKDSDLVVANLSYLQSIWGVTPYEIWMKVEDHNSNAVYQFTKDENIELAKFTDSQIQIIKNKNDPILQGTNGVLTVGFIIILIVCMTGFLIYWILSIKARVLQFGIFRAMGMSMSSVLLMLVNEQILITGLSVVLGLLIGEVSSKLFVPLIQLGYSSQDQVLPLKIIAETNDYVRLFTVIGIMITACMLVLGVIISKIKIAQALKLGED